MAKGKPSKTSTNGPNKHLHARISFLHQAANQLFTSRPVTLLHSGSGSLNPGCTGAADEAVDALGESSRPGLAAKLEPTDSHRNPATGLPLYLLSHLRAVSMKSQIRMSQEMKRSICKRCNTLLLPGTCSTRKAENRSKNGRKPWADVLLVGCASCGAEKRFPTGSDRQTRKSNRTQLPNKPESALGTPNASGSLMNDNA
ncbi:RNAse P Rpr2/Rpp21/SNM1 subunit domain-containing protein [Cryomyces antarcticus]